MKKLLSAFVLFLGGGLYAEETAPLPPYVVTGALDSATDYSVAGSSTATRTNTPIREIPQSIQVIPRAVTRDQDSRTAADALRNVSGVAPMPPVLTPAFDTTVIRGFRSEYYLDGFTQYYNTGDRDSLVNLERLEVLKGANAILYGGGSGSPVGGFVNKVSKSPQPEAFGELGITYGSHDYWQPFVDWNQPLTENVLFRLTGEYTSAASAIDFLQTDRWNVNPTVTFLGDDGSRLTLRGHLSDWRQPEYQGLPAVGTLTGDFHIDPRLFIGPSNIPDSSSEFQAFVLDFEQPVGENLVVHVLGRASHSDFEENVQTILGADGFGANVPLLGSSWGLANAQLAQEQKEFSFQSYLTYEAEASWGKNTLVAGFDHSNLEDVGSMPVEFLPVFVDLTAPAFPVPYTVPATPFLSGGVENRTTGAYAQWQATVQERLHLRGGLRAARVELDYVDDVMGATTTTSSAKLLPQAGAVLDLTNEVSIFAAYSEGLRGQPWAFFAPGTEPAPVSSDHLEAGLKFDVADQLTGQVAVYEINRQNVAAGFPALATGEQRSRGFETDLVWEPLAGFQVLASYGVTSAEFTNDDLAPVGNFIPGVPERSGRVWINHHFQQDCLKGWSAGLGVYARSGVFLDAANVFKTDGYATLDAAVTYETDAFRVTASVQNLTDNEYFDYYGYFDSRVLPVTGPSAFVTATMKF